MEEITENWLDRKYRQYAEKLREEGVIVGIAKGEARGIAKGEARGIAKGEARGIVGSILRIALERFGEVPGTLEERLQAASLEELDSWQIRMLRAPSIDEAMNGNGSWENGASV